MPRKPPEIHYACPFCGKVVSGRKAYKKRVRIEGFLQEVYKFNKHVCSVKVKISMAGMQYTCIDYEGFKELFLLQIEPSIRKLYQRIKPDSIKFLTMRVYDKEVD